MEGEAVQGEMLAMAMAARNSGGIVIAQVRELARRGSLPLRDVKVPGALVDHVYVDPDQWQTYITQDSPYYAGRLRKPVTDEPPLPLDVRKIIARRSLLEFRGAICNLGFGTSQLIGRVAWRRASPTSSCLPSSRASSAVYRSPATRAGPGSTTT